MTVQRHIYNINLFYYLEKVAVILLLDGLAQDGLLLYKFL